MAVVLLTGANGFVGQRLCKLLSSRGHEVVRLVRSGGARSAATIKDLHEDDLSKTKAKIDAIVHLAGLAHLSRRQVRERELSYEVSNVELTRKLVDFAASENVPVFVNLSSIAVVSGAQFDGTVTDLSPPAPTNPYGVSKWKAESVVGELIGKGILAVSLRPPLVIGAGAKGNWPLLLKLALGPLPLPFAGVCNLRSVIGVDELCERIVSVLEREWPVEKSGNYCVANPRPVSLSQMIAWIREGKDKSSKMFSLPRFVFAVARKTPLIGRIVQSLTGNLVIDGSRFDAEFGYEHVFDVKNIIQKSVDV